MKLPALDAYSCFEEDWALVAAGNLEQHNAMTIGWGGLGAIWGKAVATVYVRPNRYTYEFMEQNEYFTVSFYNETHKKALGVMGSKSGRNCNKDALAGLTAVKCGESVTYAEAKLTLLCRKLFAQDLELTQIPDEIRARYYKTEPSHRMYIGEVIEIY